MTDRLFSLRLPAWAPRWLPAAAVFCGSVVLVALFVAVLPEGMQANESTDYAVYYEPVARSILAGHGLVLPDGSRAISYPPGFPLLLAGVSKFSTLFGMPEGIALRAFGMGCLGLSSVMLFFIAKAFWPMRWAMLVVGLWTTYPFALWFGKQPNSELPFVAVLYGGIALLVSALVRGSRKWHLYTVSGLLLGFAALIRPIGAGIGLVCAILCWFALRRLAGRVRAFLVACLILGNIIAITPWQLWVFANTGSVIPLSTTGPSSIRDGLSFAVAAKSYRQAVDVPDGVRVVMQDILAGARAGELESFLDVGRAVIQELRFRPLATLELLLLKVERSWYGTDSGKYETPILIVQLFYLALIGLGAWHTWKQGGPGRSLVAGTLTVTLYFWGMTTMALSILRYMVPAFGLLFVLVPGTFGKLVPPLDESAGTGHRGRVDDGRSGLQDRTEALPGAAAKGSHGG